METLELDIPRLVEFHDYHEIRHLSDILQKLHKCLVAIELDLQSLGFEFEGKYVGIVCDGDKIPTDHQIKEMLNSKGQTKLTEETYSPPKQPVRRNRRR